MPAAVVSVREAILVEMAKTAMDRAMPTEPTSSKGRRPMRSTKNMAGSMASWHAPLRWWMASGLWPAVKVLIRPHLRR